jgi:2-iminobutanoate/2-iminopropanoate deaminase
MEDSMAKKQMSRTRPVRKSLPRRASARQNIVTPELLDLGKFMKAPVAPAVRAKGFIFTGGYVPLDPRTGQAVTGSIEDQTRQTLQNIKDVLKRAGSSMEKVVKVNVFLSDLSEWERMNEVYREFFPKNFPARRTVHAMLVGGYKVEIDCIAVA